MEPAIISGVLPVAIRSPQRYRRRIVPFCRMNLKCHIPRRRKSMIVNPLRLRFPAWSLLLLCTLVTCLLGQSGSVRRRDPNYRGPTPNWHGLHLINYNNDDDLAQIAGDLPALAKMGINLIILEVDYHFEFQ